MNVILKFRERNINNLCYVDDTNVTAKMQSISTSGNKKKEDSEKMKLKLNLKKTMDTTMCFRTDKVDIEMDDSFYVLGSTIHNKVTNSQEICCKLELNRGAMKALENKFGCRAASTFTIFRIMQAMVSPITLCRNESWTVKKQVRKSSKTFQL